MQNRLRILSLFLLVAAVAVLARVGIGQGPNKEGEMARNAQTSEGASGPWQEFQKPEPDSLRDRLDPLQYRVTQECGTEAPFQNAYWNNHEAGLYVDVVSGEPLFSSLDKFDSGTGWPSFTRPLGEEAVTEREDGALGMRRTEVRSTRADSHLGHIFEDGPEPTGLRYCINSAALRFIPVNRLAAEGYGDYLPLFQAGDQAAMKPAAGSQPGGKAAAGSETTMKQATPSEQSGNAANASRTGTPPALQSEIATLAGGCFWGMEDILREIPGVLNTEVGYTGGTLPNPTYADLHDGESGHAETVQVTFDPNVISYEAILGYFFRMHDPTTKNRQGNDLGSQYRSAIFVHSETQGETAERVKRAVEASGKWKKPIVTEIVPAGVFYRAEEDHQDYLEKHPDGYTCHYLRD